MNDRLVVQSGVGGHQRSDNGEVDIRGVLGNENEHEKQITRSISWQWLTSCSHDSAASILFYKRVLRVSNTPLLSNGVEKKRTIVSRLILWMSGKTFVSAIASSVSARRGLVDWSSVSITIVMVVLGRRTDEVRGVTARWKEQSRSQDRGDVEIGVL